ncbi:MAG: cation diffusion facilitator family transporter [Burkholderiales bacterium]
MGNQSGHSLSHADHHHGRDTLGYALALTFAYAIAEIALGNWLGSLALMSDGVHMISDAMALALAFIAARIAKRPAGNRHSYGFARAEIVAGFVNGLVMLPIVVLIVVESLYRLFEPAPVMMSGSGIMIVAAGGLLLNLYVAHLVGQGAQSINRRAVLLHVLADAAGSAAAILSGAIIFFSGWRPVDAILSMVIAGLILYSTVRLLREAIHVLMEGVPAGLELPEIGRSLSAIRGVRSVHDLHVWNISSGTVALSAHLEIDDLSQWAAILEATRAMLNSHFGIQHVTLQPEVAGGINQRFQSRIPIVPSHQQNNKHPSTLE